MLLPPSRRAERFRSSRSRENKITLPPGYLRYDREFVARPLVSGTLRPSSIQKLSPPSTRSSRAAPLSVINRNASSPGTPTASGVSQVVSMTPKTPLREFNDSPHQIRHRSTLNTPLVTSAPAGLRIARTTATGQYRAPRPQRSDAHGHTS